MRDLWIDYVADSGDGFNSTYAVASQLFRTDLKVKLGGIDEPALLERGNLFIRGGDLVYRTPSNQGYDDRLISPYLDAFGETGPKPDV